MLIIKFFFFSLGYQKDQREREPQSIHGIEGDDSYPMNQTTPINQRGHPTTVGRGGRGSGVEIIIPYLFSADEDF